MHRDNYLGIIYILLPLSLLYLGLTWFAGSTDFLLAVVAYITIIFWSSALISKEEKLNFIKIVSFFLFFYSVYVTVIQFVFIQDPFNEFMVPDEMGYINAAEVLSGFSYSEIWKTAFTQFKYSESPLFNAWIGTLQKITNSTPYYSLLFQKLNVVFIGSFVPGIVYLLCRMISDNKKAFKAAIIYGLFSFIFFYSVLLLRDVHVALIYGIALYIIIGERYNLKNYFILVILGLLAYYIRVENGLFFIAFMAIWLYKSGSSNKILLVTGSAAAIAGVIFVLGGIETVYKIMFSTIEGYREHTVERAGQGSLGLQLMRLPMPINYIGATAFGQISPFPFWVVFRDGLSAFKNIFYLPEAIAGLFWFSVWMRVVRCPKQAVQFFRKYKYIVLTVILYLIVVSMAVPGVRRLMAVYPVIFMAYIYISENIFKAKELLINVSVYGLLLVIYFFLKL